MGWNPWAALEATGVELIVVPALPVAGAWLPDRNVVVMAGGLSSSMQRSVLAEELAHAELGHRPVVDPVETARMELRARRLAAHRLMPLHRLVSAMRGAEHWHEVAERLDVDEQLLRLRIDELDADQRTALGLL